MQHIHVHTPSGDQCQSPQLFQAILLLSVSSYQSEEVQGSQSLQIAGCHTKWTSLWPTTHIAQIWFVFDEIKSFQH